MALYRIGFVCLIAIAGLAGCGNEKIQGRNQPRPVVEAVPQANATADVDRRATLALKQSLATEFPDAITGPALESTLTKDGFSCGPNPAAPGERACLKAKREGGCEINTIIRTKPYNQDKAQVIRICEVLPPKP